MSPRKVRALAVKELRQAARDPLSLAMLLGVPTMMLLMYGYALNFDVRHVKLAVQDLDKTARSRALTAAFVNSTYFDLVATPEAGADLAKLTENRTWRPAGARRCSSWSTARTRTPPARRSATPLRS